MIMNFVNKIKNSLTKTRTQFMSSLGSILPFGGKITDDVLDEIEEVLYGSDIGVHVSELLVGELRDRAGEINSGKTDPYSVMKVSILSIIDCFDENKTVSFGDARPYVILVVGVNGVGKTTTIGKLAYRFVREGYKVMLAAADTFRAAAIDQLSEWAKRSGVDVITPQSGADPASVAYDAFNAASARNADILIVDTAGRLHTKVNLMTELDKIHRVINRQSPGAPHEVFLVMDATTGQNGLSQAKKFSESVNVSGIILTKLDGTAKGGIIFSIVKELNIPVRYIGIGEQLDDIEAFDPEMFVGALFQ